MSVFVWFAPIEIGHILFFQMPISVGLMTAILHTNFQEAYELIRSIGIFAIPVAFVISFYYWVTLRKIDNTPILTPKGKLAFGGFFLLFNIALFTAMWHISRHSDVRLMMTTDAFFSKYRKVYPCDLLVATYRVLASDREVHIMHQKLTDFTFDASRQEDTSQREIYVLVIGESARYGNFSINGYARQTTPLLEKTENLISFSQALSTANLTETALRQLLTRATPENPDLAYQEKTLPELFAECGFKTAWIGNQSAGDRFIQRIASTVDYRYFSTTEFDAANNFDEKLLPEMDNVLSLENTKQLIVLHTLGSHFRYNSRYPQEFIRYTPTLEETTKYNVINASNKDVLVNSYDNTIAYTDFILHEIIQRVADTHAIGAVVYISDHAENLFDDEEQHAMHGTATPNRYEVHIPFLVWISDAYLQAREEKVLEMQKHKDCRISTTNLFDSFADIAGISYRQEDKRLSVAAPDFQEDSVWQVITPDKHIIKMQ
ncbi:MAG TPA: phosphoethanolamine transferase [Candidatus Parabacteroides intestinavium]|nr:phosphoethanolamine transferase [Candidatus Parabacteroides intestinavium]